ncbi:hypothetical protein EYS14_11235 [Alteromonadaceae bacterium M269]|nr:hypothetical protein EYS14_11235 [Alteromonadaceae bacterium M269]
MNKNNNRSTLNRRRQAEVGTSRHWPSALVNLAGVCLVCRLPKMCKLNYTGKLCDCQKITPELMESVISPHWPKAQVRKLIANMPAVLALCEEPSKKAWMSWN